MTTTNLIQNHAHNLLDKSLLNRLNQTELTQIFATLPDVDVTELSGNYRGKIYGLILLDRLPRIMRSLIQTILNLPLPVWKGKSFTKKHQANIWLSFERPKFFGHYRINPKDNNDILLLDYNLEQNPAVLRHIFGEVRRSGDNNFLARMNYRNGDKNICVLYFTLEPLQ